MELDFLGLLLAGALGTHWTPLIRKLHTLLKYSAQRRHPPVQDA